MAEARWHHLTIRGKDDEIIMTGTGHNGNQGNLTHRRFVIMGNFQDVPWS